MEIKKIFCALAAAACLAAGGMAGAVGDGTQIGAIAGNPDVWDADGSFAEFVEAQGCFAVTDLDGNGRLELFFVRPLRGADSAGEERDKPAMWAIASVPTGWDVRAFEAAADGRGLAPLSWEYTDVQVTPCLAAINSACRNVEEGINFYNLDTVNRTGKMGYVLYRQVISLENGTLKVQTIGKGYGHYAIYSDQQMPEGVAEGYQNRYGEPMDENWFQEYPVDYMAGCEPLNFHIGWRPVLELAEAGDTLGGMRPAFEASWQEFRRSERQ